MQTFEQLSSQLIIEEFLDSDKGTLYCSPIGSTDPEIMIRHYDGSFSSDLVQTFVELTEAARAWLNNRPALAGLVTVESLTEVGVDYVIRPFHIYQTSLSIYNDREDQSEAPEEISNMRKVCRQLIGNPANDKERIIERVISKSLLEPATKTYFDYDSRVFCIVEPAISRKDLLAWRET